MRHVETPGEKPRWLTLALVLWAAMLGTVLLSFSRYLHTHLPAMVVTTTPPASDKRATRRVGNRVQAAELPKYEVPQGITSLIVIPEVARPGEQVRVQGVGFLPGAAIEVRLKGQGMADTPVAQGFADEMGILNQTFIIPAEAATYPTPLTVEATGEGEAEIKQLQGTLWISGGGGAPPATATAARLPPSPPVSQPTQIPDETSATTVPVGESPTPVRPICTPTPHAATLPVCVCVRANCDCPTSPPPPILTLTSTPSPPPPPTPTVIPFSANYPNWQATFFDNVNWQGRPIHITNLPQVAFTWREEGPAPILGKRLYSARFTTRLPLAEGEYRFVLMGDDWARLTIDQQEIATDSAWFSGRAPTTVRMHLPSGTHTIQIDYIQYWGQASLYFYWEPALDHPRWHGTYFDGSDMNGFALGVEEISEENFKRCWSTGPPDPNHARMSDSFSSRWTRRFEVPKAGVYQICVFTHDGVRLWLDRVRYINDWHPSRPRLVCQWVELEAVTHYVFMEHFVDRPDGQQSPDDCLGVWITPSAKNYWAAAYYNNPDLNGMPTLVRSEPHVDFDWRDTSPDPDIPCDFFSVRWWRTLALPWGEHQFYLDADDGAQLRINGRMVADTEHPADPSVYPLATIHAVRRAEEIDVDISYRERAGDARVRFWMATPTATPRPRPTCTYTPAPTWTPSATPIPTLCCITPTPPCVTETPY